MNIEQANLDSLNITRPTLILDQKKAKDNLDFMIARATQLGVELRPHFKTHQSADIGEWFKERGITKITVSSLDMALYFANCGWDDITVAFPVNILEIDKINQLAEKITLNLITDSIDTVAFLKAQLEFNINLWIKVDTGYGRVGILWNQFEKIKNLSDKITDSDKIEFSGLLAHAGHTYKVSGAEEINRINTETVKRIEEVQTYLEKNGFENIKTSIGDTPSCSRADSFGKVNEIRPGNFIFYDLVQLQIGSCEDEDIAVAIACPVVSKSEEKKQIIVYGGGVHLSKEVLTTQNKEKVFGYVVKMKEKGWGKVNTNNKVISLSQEHGIIQLEKEDFNNCQIGDLLLVLPVHVCMTANLNSHYLALDGVRYSRLNSCSDFKDSPI